MQFRIDNSINLELFSFSCYMYNVGVHGVDGYSAGYTVWACKAWAGALWACGPVWESPVWAFPMWDNNVAGLHSIEFFTALKR